VRLTDRLRSEHDEFRRLGAEIESILRGPPAQIDRLRLLNLVKEFQKKLAEHSSREDAEYYPAVRQVMAQSRLLNETYMDHLDNEHKSIDAYLGKLLSQVSAPRLLPGWGQTFAIFSAGLKSHMRREEEELFPEADRLLPGAG
jgi:iron-sulfur cluster repair protein YtfE (RIC family)